MKMKALNLIVILSIIMLASCVSDVVQEEDDYIEYDYDY